LGYNGKNYLGTGVGSPRAIGLYVLTGILVAAVQPAYAGEWTLSPFVSTSTTITDNANAASDDEDRNSDQVLTVSPGVRLSGSGGRISLNLSYAHNQFFSRQGQSDDSSSNTLTANGRAEVWDQVAFVDLTTSISREIVDPAQANTNTDLGNDGNRTTVRTLSVQPFFLHHFGNWLETESRSTFDITTTESDEISNTQSTGSTFSATSGRRFSVFTFGGNFSRQKEIREDGAPRSISTTLDTNYRMRLSRKFSLISSLGWETIDDPTLTDEPNGVIWEVGFSAQPSSRSSIEATIGDRFETTTYGLDASYRLSSRSNMSASYSETITTSQEQLNENLDFLVSDGAGGFIDSRTGLAFNSSGSELGFQTSIFRQKVFGFTVNSTRRRGSYSTGLNWERRETDSTGIEETVLSVNASASRTLSSRMSASVTTSVSFTDFGTTDQRKDRDINLTGSLTYQLMENTNAALSYTRSQTHSSEGSNNLRENTVTLNLTRNF
jgi:uncharacterized protein (PEP-CTERM system associated)